MKTLRMYYLAIFLAFALSSCFSIVHPGEVGVRQRLGKVIKGPLKPGFYLVDPFIAKIVKVPTRTVNLAVNLEALPSKEGVNVDCELAILFHIEPEYAVKVVETVGVKNGKDIIVSVLRSAAPNITSQFYAKDMHNIQREVISDSISNRMTKLLGNRGFTVEAVLLKSIQLPAGLSKAIEEKLEAEQEAQKMEFVLNKQRFEAERMKIEAEAIRDAQKIISESLTPILIQFKSLEVFEKLSKSPNAKVIITDGKAPMLINTEGK